MSILVDTDTARYAAIYVPSQGRRPPTSVIYEVFGGTAAVVPPAPPPVSGLTQLAVYGLDTLVRGVDIAF